MQRIVLALLFTLALSSFNSAQGPHPARAKIRKSPLRATTSTDKSLLFALWEKREDLRGRAGNPDQYFVPVIQKLISPADLRYYSDTYKNIDDVYYRETPAGRVRIVVAYASDESQSHLNPITRVEKVYFFFDKDIALRKALAAITELRQLCVGGCILNGFSSSVIAQPAAPSDAQVALAHEMKPHWRGEDMSDATPGAEVFYVDSPYGVDFEHSPVERIDYTLMSNAGREHYTLTVVNKHPTVLDVWHPHIGDAQNVR